MKVTIFQEIDLLNMTLICTGYTIGFSVKSPGKILNCSLKVKTNFRKIWELSRLLNCWRAKTFSNARKQRPN